MKKIYFLLIALVVYAGSPAMAQDEGFIYGKIYTDSRTYEGPIRWGKEEVYWVDVFNASKEENDNLHYLSSEERERLDDKLAWRNGNIVSSSNWKWFNFGSRYEFSYKNDFTHQFSCQFGEIKSIRLISSKRAEIELQSGLKFDVDGEGYNDIGAELKIIDKEIGEMTIDWRSIDKIEFKSTPAKLEQKFGEPLYGTVETFQGTHTGYIQWDHDERLSTDKLDGDSEDGKVALLFDKIASITPNFNRCKVVLKSGRELVLRNSNDVNSENRGVIVTNEKGMMIDVPWDELKELKFSKPSGAPPLKYDNFKQQKELSATVTTIEGKTLTGKIIFDLDEQYDFELFQGKNNEIEYAMPMRLIKKITVKNESADVTLANGEKLFLKESQDVSDLNQGVLIFVEKERPVYVSWENVKEIQLN